MGTTNILDLNNRLTKVEKENVAQNSYTSLKNKPKINNVTLTGNKSSADLGLADSSNITDLQTEIGDLTALNTTDKDDVVSAINEVNDLVSRIFGPIIELNSDNNLNSLIKPGVYFYGATAPDNIPTNALNSIVSVIRHANISGNQRLLQIVYCFNLDCFFYRKSTDMGTNWGNWNQLALTT